MSRFNGTCGRAHLIAARRAAIGSVTSSSVTAQRWREKKLEGARAKDCSYSYALQYIESTDPTTSLKDAQAQSRDRCAVVLIQCESNRIEVRWQRGEIEPYIRIEKGRAGCVVAAHADSFSPSASGTPLL